MIGYVRSKPHVTARAGVTKRLMTLAGRFFCVWKNRREFDRLSEMSDAELADIGLMRNDLHVAGDLPFRLDRTAHLDAIVKSRAETSAGFID